MRDKAGEHYGRIWTFRDSGTIERLPADGRRALPSITPPATPALARTAPPAPPNTPNLRFLSIPHLTFTLSEALDDPIFSDLSFTGIATPEEEAKAVVRLIAQAS